MAASGSRISTGSSSVAATATVAAAVAATSTSATTAIIAADFVAAFALTTVRHLAFFLTLVSGGRWGLHLKCLMGLMRGFC